MSTFPLTRADRTILPNRTKSLRSFGADFCLSSTSVIFYDLDQPGATSNIRSNEARAAFATCSGT